MANLLGANIGANYKGFLNLGTTINTPLDATVRSITDGMGNVSPLQLSSSIVGVSTSLGIGTTTPSTTLEVKNISSHQIALDGGGSGIEGIQSINGGYLASYNPTNYNFQYGPLTMNPAFNSITYIGQDVLYGNLTAGYIPKKNTVTGVSNSSIYYNGTNIGIGTTLPATALDVNGIITATGGNSTSWNAKQDALVSGTNIKTINGSSILGSGNIVISGNPFTVGIQAGNATTVNTAGVSISKSFTITGNTLAATSVLDITTRLSRISGNTTMADVRIYFNTSNSLTGAILMARSTPMQTTDQSVTMQRTFTISGGNIIHTFGNSPRDTDVGVDSTAYSSSAYNVANTYYLLICSSQSGTDPFTCSMAKIAQYA